MHTITSARRDLIQCITSTVLNLPSVHVVRVGVDGVDGAGKATFADELARALEPSGRPVIRASVDSFHNPRAVRYRMGRDSPEAFFRDSYNYALLKTVLLEPLSPGSSGCLRKQAFAHRADDFVSSPEEQATSGQK